MQRKLIACSIFSATLCLGMLFSTLLAASFLPATTAHAATATGSHEMLQGPGQPHFARTSQSYTSHLSMQSNQVPLTYHGGPTMQTTSTIYTIFWEPPTLQDGTPTYVSPNYNSLIDQYFNDVSGSGLYNVNTQYYDTNGHILNNSTLGGTWVDTSPYPKSGCKDSYTPHGCLNGLQLRAEIVNAMNVNGWTGGLTHLFFIYTSWGEGSCHSDCAFSNYCAYHTYFTSNNQTILFANIPYAGTDLPNCGVLTSPNNDFDSDSAIDWMSHEQMESVTDPTNTAWLDKNNYEIGDKCNFVFGPVTLDNNTANQEWNGHFYIVQEEWSNATSACEQFRTVIGSVYVGSDDQYLYALDANNGMQTWRSQTGSSIVSSPTVVKNVSYVGSNDNSVYAFNTGDGSLLWSYPTAGPVVSSPTVVKNIVYVGSNDGSLYALNAITGAKMWSYPTVGPVASSPTVVKNIVYIGSNDGSLYALNAPKGKKLWSYATGGSIDSKPQISNGVVYVSSHDGNLYALNAASGALIWSAPTGSGIIHSSPVVVGQIVYVGSSDGNVYAFNTTSGSLLWQYATGGEVFSSPVVAYNVLYIGSWDSYIYALNATTGTLIWRYQTGGQVSSTPKVIDGILYTGSSDDKVYALWADDGSLYWQFATGGGVESSPAVILSSL